MEYQLYPAQVAAVVQALRAIFEDQRKADRVLQEVLKADKRRGSRDRAFIAESTYDIVRHYRRLSFLRGGRPRTENEWWELWGVYWTDKTNQPPPRWRELSGMPPAGEVRERYDKVRADPALDESFPDWLFELGKRELGDDWLPAIKALNKTAEVVMRVNTLKTDREDLQRRLAADDIRTEPVGEVGLKLLKRANVFGHATFQLGWFEMQDASSQRVAQALAPEPGMTVVDACAGAGGKSLHIAALMNNKGRLIALDTEEWKLEELSKRARRAGVFIADTRAITSSKIVKRLDNKADRLLLDVPCSGLGVLRRNPDAKWKLGAEFLDEVRVTQQQILRRYARMLKTGGRMVYATCSILPSENQDQVASFLSSDPGKYFHLLEQTTLLPQHDGYDGFFIATLERRKEANDYEREVVANLVELKPLTPEFVEDTQPEDAPATKTVATPKPNSVAAAKVDKKEPVAKKSPVKKTTPVEQEIEAATEEAVAEKPVKKAAAKAPAKKTATAKKPTKEAAAEKPVKKAAAKTPAKKAPAKKTAAAKKPAKAATKEAAGEKPAKKTALAKTPAKAATKKAAAEKPVKKAAAKAPAKKAPAKKTAAAKKPAKAATKEAAEKPVKKAAAKAPAKKAPAKKTAAAKKPAKAKKDTTPKK